MEVEQLFNDFSLVIERFSGHCRIDTFGIEAILEGAGEPGDGHGEGVFSEADATDDGAGRIGGALSGTSVIGHEEAHDQCFGAGLSGPGVLPLSSVTMESSAFSSRCSSNQLAS